MLINDLKYFTRSSNYHDKYSGMDNPKGCKDKTWFKNYPIQDFDYKYNSWGFRAPEYEQYRGQPVNICLGDSFTVNLGGPIEHSWPSILAKHFPIPTLNLGMDGAGNDAIKLLYYRACDLFDVQFTFVMYSYFHRRLVDGTFVQEVYEGEENFEYFSQHRIPNAIECADPGWCYIDDETQFLSDSEIYFLDIPFLSYFSDNETVDRRFVAELQYNNFKGPDWPSIQEFRNGADPHPDMFTKEFGKFISHHAYTNRDGHHMNFDANKIYANYLYNQWSHYES